MPSASKTDVSTTPKTFSTNKLKLSFDPTFSGDNDIIKIADLSLNEDKENTAFHEDKMKNERYPTPKEKMASKMSHTNMESLESYFLDNSSSSISRKAGTRTLAQLSVGSSGGLITPVIFENLRQSIKIRHPNAVEKLKSDIEEHLFPNWKFYLKEGFNILLYGVGSKKSIMDSYHKRYLSGSNCIIVPGYDSSINIRQILNTICHEFLHISDSCHNPTEQLRVICELFNREEASESPLYLLINNIDGLGLRNAKAQAILARLAEVKYIYLIASIDHVNTTILWSHHEMIRFCWIWEKCTTFLPYPEETNYANSSILQHILGQTHSSSGYHGDGTIFESLRQVATSLTQNARDIFKMVAQYQSESAVDGTKSNTSGMPLEDLYWRCRDAFLTSSESTLRAQLTEFRDHKLVKIKKIADGTELIYIPTDNSSLLKLIESIDSF